MYLFYTLRKKVERLSQQFQQRSGVRDRNLAWEHDMKSSVMVDKDLEVCWVNAYCDILNRPPGFPNSKPLSNLPDQSHISQKDTPSTYFGRSRGMLARLSHSPSPSPSISSNRAWTRLSTCFIMRINLPSSN
jgi:hypothetical protein